MQWERLGCYDTRGEVTSTHGHVGGQEARGSWGPPVGLVAMVVN